MAARMQTDATARKVVGATAGAGLGGALCTILIWVINSQLDEPMPQTVEGAMTTIITAFTTYLAGYFTLPSPADIVVNEPDK